MPDSAPTQSRSLILLDASVQAWRTFRGHPFRTLLTMLCVVWGTASVIFLMSWGRGLNKMTHDGFEKVGKNMLVTWAGNVSDDYTPAVDRPFLNYTMDDVAVVRKRMRLAEIVVGHAQRWSGVSFGQTLLSVSTSGIEPGTATLRGVSFAAGRDIRPDDERHRRRVAILGHKARTRLLGTQGVGSRVRIDGKSFEVIGILDRVGTQLWRGGPSEIDDEVWIPISTFFAFGKRWGLDYDVVNDILVRIPSRDLAEEAKGELRAILSQQLRVSAEDTEAVHIISPMDQLERMPTNELEGVMLMISITTLMIGGIGILNLMLESVQERRQEIGVRMAVGAKRGEIISQFLIETLWITGVGGALGIALGVGACTFLASLETPDLIPMPILQLWSVFLATGALGAVGVLAGVIPAWRASRIDPALTLRAD